MLERREREKRTDTKGSNHLQAKFDEPSRKRNAKEDDLPRVGRVGGQDESRQPDEAVDVAENHPVNAAERQNLPSARGPPRVISRLGSNMSSQRLTVTCHLKA